MYRTEYGIAYQIFSHDKGDSRSGRRPVGDFFFSSKDAYMHLLTLGLEHAVIEPILVKSDTSEKSPLTGNTIRYWKRCKGDQTLQPGRSSYKAKQDGKYFYVTGLAAKRPEVAVFVEKDRSPELVYWLPDTTKYDSISSEEIDIVMGTNDRLRFAKKGLGIKNQLELDNIQGKLAIDYSPKHFPNLLDSPHNVSFMIHEDNGDWATAIAFVVERKGRKPGYRDLHFSTKSAKEFIRATGQEDLRIKPVRVSRQRIDTCPISGTAVDHWLYSEGSKSQSGYFEYELRTQDFVYEAHQFGDSFWIMGLIPNLPDAVAVVRKPADGPLAIESWVHKAHLADVEPNTKVVIGKEVLSRWKKRVSLTRIAYSVGRAHTLCFMVNAQVDPSKRDLSLPDVRFCSEKDYRELISPLSGQRENVIRRIACKIFLEEFPKQIKK